MEAKRLLMFIAFTFSVVLLVQHFELPYGYFISSLLSFGKSRAVSLTGGSSNSIAKNNSKPEIDHLHTNGSSSVIIDHLKDDNYSAVESVVRNKSSSNSSYDSGTNSVNVIKPGPTKSGVSVNTSSSIGNHLKDDNYSAVGSVLRNKSSASGTNSSNIEKPGPTKSGVSVNSSSFAKTPAKKRRAKGPPAVVVPISEMNDMFEKSRVSYRSMNPNQHSPVVKELLNARKFIEGVQEPENNPHIDLNLDAVYRNYSEFTRSYKSMEKTLKIYIYTEGERPVFHQPELDGIYASEGWFMKLLEENKHFVTKNPDKAHLFYLPFSSRMLEETLYVPDSHSHKNLVQYLSRYLETISTKYRFWNNSDGADHFLVACHDWAPSETSRIMNNCIRSLCNADIRGGFQFGKDVSLPEIYVRNPTNPLKNIGGKKPSQRKTLAFFAGKMHGYLRPVLLKHWQNKDPDMKIFGKLQGPKAKSDYIKYMKSSKYCISAKGYEPYTPRVMEAVFYECVPVIVSDNYVPPFFETLNWESFAVFVLEKDVPNLKRILLNISEERYLEMQGRVRRVQKHFLWREKPVKYDVFHMILHSIWYSRVFQTRSG